VQKNTQTVFAFNSPILVSCLSALRKTKTSQHRRYVATIAIAASVIAAVRLAKVPDLELNIPKVMSTVKQSVWLARTILVEALRLF